MDEESRRLRWQQFMRRLVPPTDGFTRLFDAVDDQALAARLEDEKQLRAAMELGAAGQIDILETLWRKVQADPGGSLETDCA